MDKIKLPAPPVGEERLSFKPVKDVGTRPFTLALAEGELLLFSGGKKFKIQLIKEE